MKYFKLNKDPHPDPAPVPPDKKPVKPVKLPPDPKPGPGPDSPKKIVDGAR